MNTSDAVDLCAAVHNLAALYGYAMVNWGGRFVLGDSLVDFVVIDGTSSERPPDNASRAATLRGNCNWTLERWVTFFKVNAHPRQAPIGLDQIQQAAERIWGSTA